jgi:DNA-binding LacI/PurR family transcriptional regulator
MKYSDFANVIERRIHRGDYVIRDLPTEIELALEIGVSRKTARRGLIQLMEQGLISRKPHGRLEINRQHERLAGRLQLAFLAPAYSSPDFERYRFAVERTAAKFQASVRAVDFVHWDDPSIPKTLAGFDGVFLVLSSETIPEDVLQRISEARNLVVLDGDLSGRGVPSVQLLPPMFVHRLAEHLYDLGHRRIDCLNTQPRDEVISKRIEQWQLWQKVRKVEGTLIDEPVNPYEDVTPRAYETMKRRLDAGLFDATALLCITEPAMVGAMRAMYERGIRIGQDVSICSFDGSGRGRFQCPSNTSIQPPDAGAYLEVCLEWFLRKDEPWIGPLLIQPMEVPLFIGESTGPAPTNLSEKRV